MGPEVWIKSHELSLVIFCVPQLLFVYRNYILCPCPNTALRFDFVTKQNKTVFSILNFENNMQEVCGLNLLKGK